MPPTKHYWPVQTYCGEEMKLDLEAFRDLLAQRIGAKLTLSTIIYNILNEYLPVVVKRTVEGERVWEHWKKAPGMDLRVRKGQKPKHLGRWKGKRRTIHVANMAADPSEDKP